MRPHIREITAFLADAGAQQIRLVHAGQRHPRVVFTFNGQERRIVVSGTPRGPHAAQAAIRFIKRDLGGLA